MRVGAGTGSSSCKLLNNPPSTLCNHSNACGTCSLPLCVAIVIGALLSPWSTRNFTSGTRGTNKETRLSPWNSEHDHQQSEQHVPPELLVGFDVGASARLKRPLKVAEDLQNLLGMLFNRGLQSPSVHYTVLDNTTLGKARPLTITSHINLLPLHSFSPSAHSDTSRPKSVDIHPGKISPRFDSFLGTLRGVSLAGALHAARTLIGGTAIVPNSDGSGEISGGAPEHLVVLIHGLIGTERDLGYLARSLRVAGGEHVHCHAVVANSGIRTVDGVARGGQRAAEEVRLVVRRFPSLRRISVVGNSLGGLYARYMVGELNFTPANNSSGVSRATLEGLEPVAFVTIASPHLGVSNLTYWPLPRTLEKGFASVLQRTGGDLFRRDDHAMLYRLAFDARFLEPLGAFARRRAYANLRGDFLVLPESGVFLPDPNTLRKWRFYARSGGGCSSDDDGPSGATEGIHGGAAAVTHAITIGAAVLSGASRARSFDEFTQAVREALRCEPVEQVPSKRGLPSLYERSGGRIVSVFHSTSAQMPDAAGGAVSRGTNSNKIDGNMVGTTVRGNGSIVRNATTNFVLPTNIEFVLESLIGFLRAALILELPAADGMLVPSLPSSGVRTDEELQAMAKSLDALGWTKVLVDFPGSRIPLNHNRICALSRGPIARLLWQGGRPIMDNAAAFIVGATADGDTARRIHGPC